MITLLLSLLAFIAPTSSPVPERAVAGPAEVKSFDADWVDKARDRSLPVRVYHPADAKQPCPLVVISHGLGGSREGLEYLSRHLVSRGYITIHVQHPGSDAGVWRGKAPAEIMAAMKAAAANPANAIARPKDVTFVIDEALRLNADKASPLFGRIDPERIGVAGHSFGAYTAMAVAGLSNGTNRKAPLADPRVKAAVVLSGPASKQRNRLDEVYADIKIPCLFMTGTRDDSPIGETDAADRRIPFDHAKNCERYFVNLTDGDHMVFAGEKRRRGDGSKDKQHIVVILAGATALFDAHLRGDKAAAEYLASPKGYAADAGAEGQFESAMPAARK